MERNGSKAFPRTLFNWRVVLLSAHACLLFSCSMNDGNSPGVRVSQEEKNAQAETVNRWGISPQSLRITGAGHFVDFRYRVLDPEKARAVLDKKNLVSLSHEESGEVLYVPETKLGPLRGSSSSPIPGKTYTVIFSNRNGVIKKGARVSVMIGDVVIRGLYVE